MAGFIHNEIEGDIRIGLSEGAQIRVPGADKIGDLRQRVFTALGIIHILQAEEPNHLLDGLLIRVRVDRGGQPVSIRALHIA